MHKNPWSWRFAAAMTFSVSLIAAATVGAGDERLIANGRNPDIAVDRSGNLHLVYMSDSSVVYLKVNPSLGAILAQRVIGDGGDGVNGNPQIALDNLSNPHFLWANRSDDVLRYSFLQGSVQGPTQTINRTCGDCPGIRKPRIAIDQNNNVAYLYYEDRRPYVRAALNGVVSNRVLIGSSSTSEEDAGGVGVGADGTVHFTIRTVGSLYYRSASAAAGLSPILTAADGASDFSDVVTDAFDGSVAKIAALQAGTQGDNLRYIVRRGGQFTILQFGSQFISSENHDGVGPSLAVDRDNITYFTWSGGRDRSWYQIIGPNDLLVGTVQPLANASSHQGGKFTYPGVDAAPCGGAWATWEDDRSGNYQIFVRDINVPAGFCSSKPPVIALAGWGASSGPLFQAIAVVSDPENDVSGVELLVNDQPTGLLLNDSGGGGDAIGGDGVWTLQNSGLSLPPGRYLIGMRAVDSQGAVSDTWPYFTVGAQRRLEPSEYPSVDQIRDSLDTALEAMGIQSGTVPRVLLAGYVDTNLSASEAGTFRMVARVDGREIADVQALFAGIPLPGPVVLLDNGSQGDFQGGDSYFTFGATGLPPVTVSGRVLLELVARDLFGAQSDVWPYLTVR
jgi:hypothetical protein